MGFWHSNLKYSSYFCAPSLSLAGILHHHVAGKSFSKEPFVKRYLWTLILTMPLFLTACANSQIEKDLDQKLQSSSAVRGKEDLDVKAETVISNNSSLSQDQKAKLMALQKRAHDQTEELRNQSFKLRDLLITDVAGPTYSEDEVTLIKDRLYKIQKQRLAVIFDSVDEANKILGRETANRYIILRGIGGKERE